LVGFVFDEIPSNVCGDGDTQIRRQGSRSRDGKARDGSRARWQQWHGNWFSPL
jgi:hypothetical protein